MHKRTYYSTWEDLTKDFSQMNDTKNYSDIKSGKALYRGRFVFGSKEDEVGNIVFYVDEIYPYKFDYSKYNIYEDLINSDIRPFIPYLPAREIRNAQVVYRKNGKYRVKFEYLPMQRKRSFNSAIGVDLFKIGDWTIIENDKAVYDLNIQKVKMEYGSSYDSYTVLGTYLVEFFRDIIKAKQDLKSNQSALMVILENFVNDVKTFWKQQEKDSENYVSFDEIKDQIALAKTLSTKPVEIKLVDFDKQWNEGIVDLTKQQAERFTKLVNNQNLQYTMAQSLIDNPYSKYGKGGSITEQNYQMALSDAQTVMHHAKELNNALKKNKQIPAWVIAKLHQSSTTLSDITHYLESTANSKYATGGNVPDLALKIGDHLKMKYSNDEYQLISLTPSAYTVAKIVNGHLEEYMTYPYNIIEHGLFSKG